MKKNILERYVKNQQSQFVLDIAADKVSDLYNNFDRHTPFSRKELDQDLADYIVDSVTELVKEKFIIQFSLASLADDITQQRVKDSIKNYFDYINVLEEREWSSMKRASLILAIIGIVMVVLSVWAGGHELASASVIGHVFTEGLTVAAWVSLWNAMATFLINWVPHRNKLKVYRRVMDAEIFFQYRESVI